ncbi:unnamed protein product [Coffea canephora]|uniref:Aquaporin n=1 Tax=Coffea canephora TaxID=49390 RepID=A0A068UVU5_COFCA|nr:unnamed protein product [Coffea canephora]
MIFALVYCTAGISGIHINPAGSFGLHLSSCRSILVIRTSRKRTRIYTSSS